MSLELAEAIRQSQGSYRATFLPAAGQTVLRDLAKICFAAASTFHTDPRIDAYQQGQRSVWLHISQRLGLTTEELYALLRGAPINRKTED